MSPCSVFVANMVCLAAALLLDLSKCYERVPLHLLIDGAIASGWPGAVVCVAVAQYALFRWVSLVGATFCGPEAVCGMIPSSAAITSTITSVTFAPRARMLVNAS